MAAGAHLQLGPRACSQPSLEGNSSCEQVSSKQLTALQAKVHYLRYLSELQLYGGREFKSILLQGEKQTEVTLLVGPRYGISHVINARTNLVALLADFSHVNRIEILNEDQNNVRLELHVLDVRPITLIMESSDAMNLACLTAGYYRLLVDSRRSIFNMIRGSNSTEDDNGQDRVLEWPYSTSFGDSEVLSQSQAQLCRDSQCSDNEERKNSLYPYCHQSQNPDRAFQTQSPVPPPLPPSTRHKPQDSPHSAKVSFIFEGEPPLNKPRSLIYERLQESAEVAEHRTTYLHNTDFETPDRKSFHFSDLTHVYSNIITEEGGEEPLLRDLFYRDTTDDAEDEDEASCEEDSTGGTGGEVREGVATAAGKASFLLLSGPTDDIIDLTSLPPPEGDDAIDDDEDDSLLQTLNLAIAAPPPGFQDNSDEDMLPEEKLLSPHNNHDIPVSLIGAIPSQEDRVEEGRRQLDNTVVKTLQALEALSVSEQKPPPPPRPPLSRNNPGVYTSRGYSPESSSDSGNETNSSEMTELSELAACHRLNESHMRLLVATREGYQPLLEEKTEFPVSPSTAGTTQKKSRSPQHLRPPAVPPRRSPHLDTAGSLRPDCLRGRSQTNLSSTLQRPNSTTPGGKHQKKSADSSGKYNTFSTREGYQSGSGGTIHLEINQRTPFCDRGGSQRRLKFFLEENSQAQDQDANSLSCDHSRIVRPASSPSDGLSGVATLGECVEDNRDVEQDEHLVVASLVSPNKNNQLVGSDQGSDLQNDHHPISRQQSVARLCEYHLAKRISNLQGDAHNSLQGSLCSSLDTRGSANSSVCATPTDSPLGPGATESKHHRLQRHPISNSSSSLLRVLNYDELKPGQSPQTKDLHPHADPVLLRKMLPNIHTPADPGHPSSATPSTHKETITSKKPCFKGPNQKEGSEAYRQFINYLTVSQMHQGGKLHSAGMGGGVKKDTRRYITSNPQLVEMAKNRGSTISRCHCMPSSISSPFVRPNLVNPNAVQVMNRDQKLYHSATLPAKFKRSPEMATQGPNGRLDAKRENSERRSSFSGLQSELERSGMDLDQFLSVYKTDGYITHEVGGTTGRPPSRSRSQPSGCTDEWWTSDPRERHTVLQTSASCLSGQQVDLSNFSLERGPSAFTRQTSTSTIAGISSPSSPIHTQSPPPPVIISAHPNTVSSNSRSTHDVIHSTQSRPTHNNILAVSPMLSQLDSVNNYSQRGRELKHSSGNVTNSSGSVEVLFEKHSRSQIHQPLSPSVSQQGETKVQRRPTRKRLSKSYSQGSVSSHSTCWSSGTRIDSRRASVALPLQKDNKQMKGSQKLDTSPWRCNGPFSYCFFKRKGEGEDDESDWDTPRRSRGGCNLDNNCGASLAIFPCGSAVDAAGEQLYGEVLNNMSFSDRLARVNALKDHMYSFPYGFTEVRRDASELIALVRSSIGRCDRGVQMPMQEVSQSKQLLSVESKELGRACRRMAQAHSSPEEMLLAVTCSFQLKQQLWENRESTVSSHEHPRSLRGCPSGIIVQGGTSTYICDS